MMDTVRTRGHLRVDKYDAAGVLFETVEAANIFLTTGINQLWSLITGASANTFTNATATIGIGDSSTAAAAGQTDLQASTNKAYVAMAATYPTAPSAGAVQFQSVFGPSVANYAWNEFVVRQSSSLICIDRGVSVMGTKASGTTWTALVTLTIA